MKTTRFHGLFMRHSRATRCIALTLTTLVFSSLAVAQNPPALKPGLYAIFNTSEGAITARLYEKYTPRTVANFVALAQGTKPWRDPKTGAMVRRPLDDVLHRVLRHDMQAVDEFDGDRRFGSVRARSSSVRVIASGVRRLVGGIGREALLFGNVCFEPCEHGVEGVGEFAELI